MLFSCSKYPNITVYTGSSMVRFKGGKYSTENEDEIKILESIPYIEKEGADSKAKSKLK